VRACACACMTGLRAPLSCKHPGRVRGGWTLCGVAEEGATCGHNVFSQCARARAHTALRALPAPFLGYSLARWLIFLVANPFTSARASTLRIYTCAPACTNECLASGLNMHTWYKFAPTAHACTHAYRPLSGRAMPGRPTQAPSWFGRAGQSSSRLSSWWVLSRSRACACLRHVHLGAIEFCKISFGSW